MALMNTTPKMTDESTHSPRNAAGATTTDDGQPVSINVEQVAGTLLVQHYVPEVLEPHHCVLVSQTDVITRRGRTTIQITWELSAEIGDAGRCTYTNTVSAHATDEFLSFLGAEFFGKGRIFLKQAIQDPGRGKSHCRVGR